MQLYEKIIEVKNLEPMNKMEDVIIMDTLVRFKTVEIAQIFFILEAQGCSRSRARNVISSFLSRNVGRGLVSHIGEAPNEYIHFGPSVGANDIDRDMIMSLWVALFLTKGDINNVVRDGYPASILFAQDNKLHKIIRSKTENSLVAKLVSDDGLTEYIFVADNDEALLKACVVPSAPFKKILYQRENLTILPQIYIVEEGDGTDEKQ